MTWSPAAVTVPAVAVAGNREGEDQIDAVAGVLRKAPTRPAISSHRNGDRPLALGQDGGQEPPIARLLAMQKVVGLNPISRLQEKPPLVGGDGETAVRGG